MWYGKITNNKEKKVYYWEKKKKVNKSSWGVDISLF